MKRGSTRSKIKGEKWYKMFQNSQMTDIGEKLDQL